MLLSDPLQIDQPSLQQHCISILDEAGTSISKQGIDKRFKTETVAFVQTIFEQYLKYQIAAAGLPSGLRQYFTAIRIMDSTQFKLPRQMAEEFPGYDGDGTEACAQLQFEYDLLSGQINHLSFDSARASDVRYAHEVNKSLQPGELILRDLGYYTLQMYKEVEEQQAFFVSRLKSQVTIFEKNNEVFKELTHKQVISRLKKTKANYIDLEVYIGKESKKPVRLIANLLDSEAINHRVKRKRTKKRKLNQDDQIWTQFNLFVTNVSRQVATAEEIYHLYKLRWQIELIFKGWKSILKVHLAKPMKVERYKCYLISKLIWIVLNWDIYVSFCQNGLQKHQQLISHFKTLSLLKLQAKTLLKLIFGSQNSKLRSWLAKLYETIMKYAVKENKKGRLSVKNILKT